MRFYFVPTIGRNHYMIEADNGRERVPVISLDFVNEFTRLPDDIKEKVAERVLNNVYREIDEMLLEREQKYKPEEGF